VSTTATASEFRDAVKAYYDDLYDTDISVSLEMRDAAELVVTDQAESVKNIYTITYLRATSTATATSIRVTSSGSAAIGSALAPDAV